MPGAIRATWCSATPGGSSCALPDAQFDVIILDGFCSDAIPVHLLTREAFQLYFQKLAPGGVLAMHVSNNHLDLPPLVARLARRDDPPLSVRYSHDMASEGERADGKTRLAVDGAGARRTRTSARWRRIRYWEKVPDVDGPVWRDDFANLLKVWKKGRGALRPSTLSRISPAHSGDGRLSPRPAACRRWPGGAEGSRRRRGSSRRS